MIFAAANALSNCSPAMTSKDRTNSLLPDIAEARHVSLKVATAVVQTALETGEARLDPPPKDIEATVREFMWEPRYPDYELA